MISVEFLGPIGKPTMMMKANTLHDVACEIKKDPTMAQWIDNCAVAVNDRLVSSLDTLLHEGDKVSLLPPVCGG